MPSDTEEDHSGPPRGSNVPAASPLIMPWFYSAPWLPKFSGERRRFGEWRSQVWAMLRAQPLSAEQQADFVFSALEGEARREIALLDEDKRNTGDRILSELKSLYGETVSAAQARATFFKCRQHLDEKVGDFILRLRESHSKWKGLDREAAGEDDEVLLDQFVLGLKTSSVRTELQRHLRRRPGQSFKAVTAEARALEEELEGCIEEAQASTVRTTQLRATPTPPGAPVDQPAQPTHQRVEDWKEQLRRELQQELADQVKALGAQLVEQLRGQVAPPNRPGDGLEPRPQGSSMPPPTQGSSSQTARYQWDPQGRPICLDCREAGHVQRHCPKRQRTAQGFQNPPPQRAGRWGW